MCPITDRSVPIEMKRRTRDETVERWRILRSADTVRLFTIDGFRLKRVSVTTLRLSLPV
jgi:hypothetical protein